MEIYNFKEYNKKEHDLKKYHDNMMKVITDYVKFDVDFQKNHKIDIKQFKGVFDIYRNQNGHYMMKYHNSSFYSTTEIELFYGEFKDVEQYMENPEIYKLSKTAKKFNL